jgi:hypothetical protein
MNRNTSQKRPVHLEMATLRYGYLSWEELRDGREEAEDGRDKCVFFITSKQKKNKIKIIIIIVLYLQLNVS